jgi:hypothetical protein
VKKLCSQEGPSFWGSGGRGEPTGWTGAQSVGRVPAVGADVRPLAPRRRPPRKGSRLATSSAAQSTLTTNRTTIAHFPTGYAIRTLTNPPSQLPQMSQCANRASHGWPGFLFSGTSGNPILDGHGQSSEDWQAFLDS